MSFAKFLSGLVSLFNRLFKNQRENELRKDGARETDLQIRGKQDEIRKKAKKIRRDSAGRSKPDILERL